MMRIFLAAACLMGIAMSSTRAAETSPQLERCAIDGIAQRVWCGRLNRALDPSHPEDLRFDLHFVVVPALARRKHPDPVMVLAGGPGQSAIDVAGQLRSVLARVNNRRDLIFVDQRGTGRSAPLRCDDSSREALSETDAADQVAQFAACRERLEKLPYVGGASGLRMFSTTLAMRDLDAVRMHLGVQQVNLLGVSYGTRAGLEYLRLFPRHVRRAVFDGVVPPGQVLPTSASLDAQAAFDAMLAACNGDTVCARTYPTLRQDWTKLLKSLPRSISVAHPLSGRIERFELTRDALLQAVRSPLYFPAIGAALPAAITEAAAGRFEPLVGLSSVLSSRRGLRMAMGMHFSVVCAEDAPRMDEARDNPGADFGRAFENLYRRVCQTWPRAEIDAAFFQGPSAVSSPLLLLSGGLDPATPPRHAAALAAAVGRNARHEVIANAGHGTMALGCMPEVIFRFFDEPDDVQALAVDAGCARRIPRPAVFVPMSMASRSAP